MSEVVHVAANGRVTGIFFLPPFGLLIRDEFSRVFTYQLTLSEMLCRFNPSTFTLYFYHLMRNISKVNIVEGRGGGRERGTYF